MKDCSQSLIDIICSVIASSQVLSLLYPSWLWKNCFFFVFQVLNRKLYELLTDNVQFQFISIRWSLCGPFISYFTVLNFLLLMLYICHALVVICSLHLWFSFLHGSISHVMSWRFYSSQVTNTISITKDSQFFLSNVLCAIPSQLPIINHFIFFIQVDGKMREWFTIAFSWGV